MKLSHLCVLAVVLAAGSSSCASWSYQNAPCNWIELGEAPGLEVTGRRVTAAPWEQCTDVNAPGYFLLRRAAYTVEFWNGERELPELFVRVFGAGGKRMVLRSAHLAGEPNAKLRSSGPNRTEYDYRLLDEFRFNWSPFLEFLEFAVLDDNGEEIGHESLKVVAKTGGTYRAYY